MAHAIVLEAGVDRSAARAISGVPVATLAGVVARTAHEAVGVQVAVVGALALACLPLPVCAHLTCRWYSETQLNGAKQKEREFQTVPPAPHAKHETRGEEY